MATDSPRESSAVGEARIVLVVEDGGARRGVITSVSARVEAWGTAPAEPSENAIVRIVGPTTVSDRTQSQIDTTIVPTVGRIFDGIGLYPKRFALSFVNVGAASSRDLVGHISGLSADSPIILALVSVVLDAAVRPGLLATGHLASCDGVIAPVSDLDVKFAAASDCPAITRILYPADDRSEDAVNGKSSDRHEALARLDRRVEAMAIGGIDDLIAASFDDESLVIAACRGGYYAKPAKCHGDSRIDTAARYLCENNERRFSDVLSRHLQAGDQDRVSTLLEALMGHCFREGWYPSDLGRLLRNHVLAVPPAIRRLMSFPLVALGDACKLAALASPGDEDDIGHLLDAIRGRQLDRVCSAARHSNLEDDAESSGAADAAVAYVLDRLSPEALYKRFALPIDAACESYPAARVSVSGHEQFFVEVVSRYRHLAGHSDLVLLPDDAERVEADAIELIAGAFAKEGGIKAAEQEARRPMQGGLRHVMSRMASHLREKLTYWHAERILKEAVDPLDSVDKRRFMTAFLARAAVVLPDDVRQRPVEDFIEHRETLIRAYVSACDHLADAFRAV